MGRREKWQKVEEKLRKSAERAFQYYRRMLETVTSFKYLGWILTVADND